MNADFLVVSNLSKCWGEKTISISFGLQKGSALALLGPSGCGKSTILKMISGLLPPDSGTVFLEGKDITEFPPSKRKIGMVFQDYALFPHLTVQGNITYGLKFQGLSKKEAAAASAHWIELFKLQGMEKRKIDTLSGGEKQRVALARSLAVNPEIILFDEPLSALDTDLRIKLQKELRAHQQTIGYTAIYVTHDKDEARILADSIIYV
ncbi:ABC transporter ATP-binding protein [Treponema phagedenis]|uniref:ABC transporter ATP-binding protein n=1 Tax=Treponema phagedenis TaxID=162 RepID=A0A0B7GWX4_TREPH|nr:ABC transporter ATP-binding protein [Treponema phagedenis]NVP25137.1 ABC transporter ATP-binding protein [Treponema phagedenis]QEJ96087.1 ABC transporter ATP-binding protein [Treponema phagedenis]QEJ97251.1 ABC transporter ATP-binding protein [Treponema phagedenis]QEK01850.1 ABC transporter ATP-binding protein [Treponema phagedenis]QEK02556.1 ABC transporter ATP-binding protein [Treponema phagedenis]